MTLYQKIADIGSKIWQSDSSIRIVSELNYASSVSAVNDNAYDGLLEKAADIILRGMEADGGLITPATADLAEQALLPMQDAAKSYRVHTVSHAHIDMNWLWGYQETASVTVDTFRTVLDMMKEYPKLTYAQSQASTYKIIEDYAPEMLEEIKEMIRAGRWEVSASTWVENDKNLPNGESLARHILYTKRYLSRLLDISAESMQLDFEPDTFGHNISVPEVCNKGGIKYYYHCRGNDTNEYAYVWRARSGAELLVWRDPVWYNYFVNGDMFRKIPQLCKKNNIPCFLSVYGLGDHGGGPSRRDLNNLMKLASWPIMPTVLFSSYSKFFAELEKYRANLPVIEGELNSIYTGCYTSQARIKMANRIAEDRIYESEEISAVAKAFAGGHGYVRGYEEAWKKILFNQFHDIIPGSGVRDTREYALGQFQQAMAAVQTHANNSMRAIAEKIDTSALTSDVPDDSTSEGAGVGFLTDQSKNFSLPSTERGRGKRRVVHFFNTTQYDFDGVTELTVWDWDYPNDRAVITDASGRETELKLVADGRHYWGHYYKSFAVLVHVPAFGYATYILSQREITSPTTACIIDNISARYENICDDDLVMENGLIKAVFDRPTMQVKSLINKKTGENMVSGKSCTFRLIMESVAHGMSAWRLGEYMTAINLNETCDVCVTECDLGGVRKWIRYGLTFGNKSTMNVTVSLDEASTMLNFAVDVDLREIGTNAGIPQLNFIVPVAYKTENYRYDVPFGTIDRPQMAHDVSANSFAAAIPVSGEDKAAVMMVSDSKYGYRGNGNAIALTLIRATNDPDPCPEFGLHNIRIGVGITDGVSNGELFEKSSAFVHPLAYCTSRASGGTMPLDGKFITIAGNARVSSVKTAEDRDALVIRLSDEDGCGGGIGMTFAKTPSAAYITDVNENIIAKAEIAGGVVKLNIKPYALETVLVEF